MMMMKKIKITSTNQLGDNHVDTVLASEREGAFVKDFRLAIF